MNMTRTPRLFIASRILGIGLGAALLTACPQWKQEEAKPAAKATPPPAPVVVAEVMRKDVPAQIQAIGRVEPISTVMVKAQVSGILEKAHFAEGQDVKKGDLLFTIDSRPFVVALKEAKARLEKDQAELAHAHAEAERFKKLIDQRAIAPEQAEAASTKAAALTALVRGDEAAIEMAQLNLGYSEIRSPIDGRTGSLKVHPGNLLRMIDIEPLVTIHQMEPIYVTFAVPEQRFAEIARHQAKGNLKVLAGIRGDSQPPVEGELTFIDSNVDRETGTISLKAKFSNSDRRLWPGLFVNVTVTLETRPGAVVVPARAIQTGQRGPYVFVVKDGKSADMRPVKPGLAVGEEIVIDEGLEPGEKVVTEGHLRLIPGAVVDIKPSADEPAPPKPEKPS